jgi:hypothetical protein
MTFLLAIEEKFFATSKIVKFFVAFVVEPLFSSSKNALASVGGGGMSP